jgi:hypothetical protein
MAKYAQLSDGRLIEFDDAASDEFMDESVRDFLANEGTLQVEAQPEPEPDPFADQRTATGQAFETIKGVGRGFGGSFLTAAEGLAELADAGTNALGYEDLIDSGDENALVKAARSGQEAIQDAIGADRAYQDTWLTKFGEGLGSFASFFTPAGVAKGVGLTGKAYTAATRGAAVPLAVGVGSGEQAQRIALAREQGIDVSEGQEDLSILGGGFVGLSELASVSSLLSRIDKTKAGDGFIQEIKRRLGSAVRSGLEEGTQEVLANIAQDAIERGVYNENLQSDMSLKGLLTSDEFTIGGASGFAVDLVLNSIGNKRNRFANDAERDFEAGLRDKEAQEIAEIEQNVAEFETAEQEGLAAAESVQNLARSLQLNEPTIIPSQLQLEDWNDLAVASSAGTTVGPRNIANEAEALTDYGNQIQANLNSQRKFPKSGQFTRGVGQGTQVFYDPQDGSEMIPVSQELATPNQAGQLVGILEEKRQDRAINSQISRIIRNNETELDQPRVNTLAAWGRAAMNPKVGLIPRTRVDSVFNTTDISKGYQENLTSQEAIDAGATLTASQQINKKRREKDPNAQDKNAFSVEEIKAAFPDSDLGEVSISAEEDITYQVIGGVKPTADPKKLTDRDYTPYKVQGFNRSGEPVGNPFDAPVKFDSTGKIIPPTPDEIAATNFDRARPEIKAKTPFIITKGKNKGKPVTDQTTKEKKRKQQREDEAAANKADAQAFADQLNADRSYLFKEADSATTNEDRNILIENILLGPPVREQLGGGLQGRIQINPDGSAKRQSSLGKNVTNSYGSPELQVYVQNAIGRKPPFYLKDLSKGEFRLVTKKLASLPRFNSPTKIPLFTMEEASRNRQSIQPVSIAVEPQLPETPVTERTIKRGSNFSLDGNYDVTYSDGTVYQISRDAVSSSQPTWLLSPESLDSLVDKSDLKNLYSLGGIGYTRNEALAKLDELHAEKMAKLAAPQVVQPDAVAPQEEVFLLPAPAPVEEVAPAEVSTALNKLRTALRSRLDKFGLKNIGVSIEESLERAVRTPDGRLIFGKQYDPATKSLIDAQPVDPTADAVFDPDTSTIMFGIDRIRGFETMSPQEQEDAMASLLDHEMLHAMRRLDLFTEQEYQILVDQVTKQTNANGETYLQAAERLYGDQGPVVQVEEAIAELTRDARADQRKVVGKPKALLNRILRFMTSLKNAINGLGFDSFDALIGRIEGGEIGRRKSYAETRDVGDVRDLVLTDLKRDQALQDVLVTGRGATGADEREDRGEGQTLGDFEIVGDPENINNAPENVQEVFRDKLVYSRRTDEQSPNIVDYLTGAEEAPILPKQRGKILKKDVATYLQDRAIEKLGGRIRDLNNAEDRDAVADDMVVEAIHEINTQEAALEWYDKTIDRMIGMMSLKHPEILNDRDKQTGMFVSLAITSQNLDVPTNLRFGEQAYKHFAKKGKFPIIGTGKSTKVMKANFKKANLLIDELGSLEAFRDFLDSKFTVGQLNPILDLKLEGYKGTKAVGGENVDTAVYGSSVFGPKVGNGFYTNLRGDFSPVTMDMWFMRTVGRLTGKLLEFERGKFDNQLKRFAEAENLQGATEKQLIDAAFVIKKQHEKDYKEFRQEYDDEIRVKSEGVKAADTIVKSLTATRDAPASGGERNLLRDVVKRAVDKFNSQTGNDISPAAFQALIWYPEQDLYKKLGVQLKHVRQDYASATEALLREEGYSEGDIVQSANRVRGGTKPRSEQVRQDTGEVERQPTQETGEGVGEVVPLAAQRDLTEIEGIEMGINVATDGNINYADLIVTGQKQFESRDTDSLRPYVGKRVGIVETRRGQKARLVGDAIVGEPQVVGEAEFDASRELHLVPENSKFDIKQGQTKHLYEMIDPRKLDEPIDASATQGIVARNIAALTGKQGAQEFLSKDSKPREQITQIPQGAIDKAVQDNIAEVENIPTGEVPFYSVKADPRSQYIARNPEEGSKPRDRLMYSRSRQPEYNPEARSELDKLVDAPIPNQTPFETYLEATDQSKIGAMLTRLRAALINKYTRLEDIKNQNFRNQLADSSAFAAAIMADKSKAVTAAALQNGVPVYTNGVTKVQPFVDSNGRQYRGLIEVMNPLMNNEYNVDLEKLAQAYAIAKRSEVLRQEGKPTPATENTLANLQPEINKYINRETGRPIVEEWYDAWTQYNNKTIDFLVDTGVLAPEMRSVWQESAYVPFYRQAEDPDAASPYPSVFKGMTSAATMTAYKGSDKQVSVPLLESIVRNLSAAIDMGMKNVAQQRIVRDQINLGMAREVRKGQPATNVVKFKVKGKNREYEIADPLLYESLQAFGDGATGLLTNVLGGFSGALRELITRDPGFMMVNMMRDTLSTFATSGSSFIPVIDTLKNFNSGAETLEKYGVVGGYDIGVDSKDIFKQFQKEAKKRQNPVTQFVNLWDFLGRQTTKSDAATRKAVYDDVLAKTGNEAEAAFQALEVINFSRRGSSALAKTITAAIPFLNARFQGLDVLYRAGKGYYTTRTDQGVLARRSQLAMRGLTLASLTALYWSMVSDDEQYKEQSEFVKDNNWILPNPFSDKHPLLIPIPFEVGLLFKTLPERILDYNLGSTSQRELVDSGIRNLTSTLAINPLGVQAVAPIIEATLNYDFFTGRPIESIYMTDNNLERGLRSRMSTNELAKFIGEQTNISPLKIDHMLHGYLGTIGSYGLLAVDAAMRSPAVAGEDAAVRPAMPMDQIPMIKRVLGREFGAGLQEDFYEMRQEVNRFQGTVNELISKGDMEKLQKYLQGREHLQGLASDFRYYDKQMKLYRDTREAIEQDTRKTAEQKAKEVREIDESKQQYLRQINVLKNFVDADATQAFNLYRDQND